MIGLIGLSAVAGYLLHNANKSYNIKRKSNSYTIAKLIESAIDSGEYYRIRYSGNFDKSEVIRIMAEDGYDFFRFCKLK